ERGADRPAFVGAGPRPARPAEGRRWRCRHDPRASPARAGRGPALRMCLGPRGISSFGSRALRFHGSITRARTSGDPAMPRPLVVAACQMGPIPRSATRAETLERLIAMMHDAKARGAELVVYTEAAL